MIHAEATRLDVLKRNAPATRSAKVAPEVPPTILVTLGSMRGTIAGDTAAPGSNQPRPTAEAQVALGNAVFAHLRRMHGPNVHVSVAFGPEPVDECVVAGITPDPEFAILEAIATIREAQGRTGATRSASVRVVLPDGIVLDAAANAPDEVALFESGDDRLAILVEGWAVTGFELLVGWRLVPDVRALLAGETIPTHTRWVHDGAVLVVWTDGRFLFEGGDGAIGQPDAAPPRPSPVATGEGLGRGFPPSDPDPWQSSWDWVASVTRDGQMRHAERLSARCRRILDLPPEAPALPDY